MKFQKKRAEIRIDVYEDGEIENIITGNPKGAATALAYLLCVVCIDCRVDGISRGDLRERLMAQIGEIFDDVWRAENLRGELE